MKLAGREISRVGVLGFARTGRAATNFLLARGVEPFVSDSNPLVDDARAWLKGTGIAYEEGGHTAELLTQDLIVLSPVVSPRLPLLNEARQNGILVISELDLATQVCPMPPIIAVTGTNGKSTTVLFIEALLRRRGLATIVAGNIGTPVVSIVEEAKTCDALVIETSSFQLEQSLFFHPHVAVLLNISHDHLDRHKTMSAYAAAKARIFRNQTEEDVAIIPSGLVSAFPGIAGRKVLFDRVRLPSCSAVSALPPHNRSNLQAAIAACTAIFPSLDIGPISASELEEAFALPYRLHDEGEIDGIRLINDSKSTNADSAVAALHSVRGPLVLLLGGRQKRGGYDALAEEISKRSVRTVVVYGEAAPFLFEVLQRREEITVLVSSDFESAVRIAQGVAHPGDTLLFSPACSSYDQFRDYIDRGAAFSRLIRISERDGAPS